MKNISYVYQKNHILMNKIITDIIQYLEFVCLSIINEAKVRIFLINPFYPYLYYELKKKIMIIY